MNRTLLDMLGTLSPEQKSDWKKHISALVLAYNSTKHETTGFEPYYLMFGRKPRLPVDVALGIGPQVKSERSAKFVEDLRQRLEDSFKLVTERTKVKKELQKSHYDQKVRGATVEVGDQVLVRNVAFHGPHKLADRWQEEVHCVLSQPNRQIPVFEVQDVKQEGPVRTLHRNMLLPVSDLRDVPARKEQLPKPRKAPTTRHTPSTSESSSVGDSSDPDVFIVPHFPPRQRPVPVPRRSLQQQPHPVVPDPVPEHTPPEDSTGEESVEQPPVEEAQVQEQDPVMESDGEIDQLADLPVDAGEGVFSDSSSSEEQSLPRRSQRNRRRPVRFDPDVYVLRQHVERQKQLEKQNQFLKQFLKAVLDS